MSVEALARGLSLALLVLGVIAIAISGVLKWLMQGEVRTNHQRWTLMADSIAPEEAYKPRGLKLRQWRLILLGVGGASCAAGWAIGHWLKS